ncbi:inositol hexakisphosphate and diphosphoinositol-pentakisphosphate kinase 2-like isoform X1 [Sycon ciliatum]|uniref:inositol hexakisphosphate and diphosphoinositol-pentakisphosphate kinase 2-like isoform X1 n=1 Tax=Sycon ciliatum TaxID=27933 RepID=UPI0031F72225
MESDSPLAQRRKSSHPTTPSATARRNSSGSGGVRRITHGSSCPEAVFPWQNSPIAYGIMQANGSSDPRSGTGTYPCTSEEAGAVKLGVCAMSRKVASKPMQTILSRIQSYGFIEVIIFDDDTILNKPIEEWPHCNALISFFSTGFPLKKAIEYAKLRQPFLVNDLELQPLLQHRPSVYAELEKHGIETPRYKILDRSEGDVDILEDAESVSIDGETFIKPFVEKPVNAEDHNVYIYYPPCAGGGSQRLFRKIHDRASFYSSETKVRSSGSFIYEEFMPTDGTDVKVYTVGPNYAHAEARKSPALDGKVERDAQGKEVRYPVILSAYEKEIARKVCVAFKQGVCGFDLLRAHGKSYVCDVNGFSFVKTSQKYYADSAQILSEMIIMQCAPHLFKQRTVPAVPVPLPQPSGEPLEELRCVIGIMRHGDRTPKQKMKMVVQHEKFYSVFQKNGGNRKLYVKLKKPEQLQEVLDVARFLLDSYGAAGDDCQDIAERKSKLQQMKSVLEMHGYFSGINRKVQFKYRPHRRSVSGVVDQDTGPHPDFGTLLLILKWGGELTPAGRIQAEQLGKEFRCIYPGGEGEYGALPGSGLLRLHSTYRHDLKIYASDEGRVQTTAAAFAKGFLALEGELTPILVHLVKSYKTNNMLDKSDAASDLMAQVKAHLHTILRQEADFTDEDVVNLAPTLDSALTRAMDVINNPTKTCERLHRLVNIMVEQIQDLDEEDWKELYNHESRGLMLRRWEKLQKDFKPKGKFDYSKIPDIFDCIKFDILHNHHLGLRHTEELFEVASSLAHIVIPQEYGITAKEKAEIARLICTPLVRKIRGDLKHQSEEMVHQLNPEYSWDITSPRRNVRTRLYFTSESHIHSVLNLLSHSELFSKDLDDDWKRGMQYISTVAEYSYMTQIVFLLYEATTKELEDEDRFRLEVLMSPGASVQLVDEVPTPPMAMEPTIVDNDNLTVVDSPTAAVAVAGLANGASSGNAASGSVGANGTSIKYAAAKAGIATEDDTDTHFSPPHSYSSWRPPTSSAPSTVRTIWHASDGSRCTRTNSSSQPDMTDMARSLSSSDAIRSRISSCSLPDTKRLLLPSGGTDTNSVLGSMSSSAIGEVDLEFSGQQPTLQQQSMPSTPGAGSSTCTGSDGVNSAVELPRADSKTSMPPLSPSADGKYAPPRTAHGINVPLMSTARSAAAFASSSASPRRAIGQGLADPTFQAKMEPLKALVNDISLHDFDAFLERVLEAPAFVVSSCDG